MFITFAPGENDDTEDVTDDADGNEDVGEHGVRVPMDQVDDGLLLGCCWRLLDHV